jgi:hypothetical protein
MLQCLLPDTFRNLSILVLTSVPLYGVLNKNSQISNVKIEDNYICIEFSNYEKLEVYFSSLNKIENLKVNNYYISKVQWEDLIDNPIRKRD